jgi:hypothetical protein
MFIPTKTWYVNHPSKALLATSRIDGTPPAHYTSLLVLKASWVSRCTSVPCRYSLLQKGHDTPAIRPQICHRTSHVTNTERVWGFHKENVLKEKEAETPGVVRVSLPGLTCLRLFLR